MPRPRQHVVRLSLEQREQLQRRIRCGMGSALVLTRARILLKVDQGPHGPAWTDKRAAEACEVTPQTVGHIRQRFIQRGLEGALRRKPQQRPSRRRKLDGAGEARLVAVCCSSPPQGRQRWTLRLLADQLVELRVVEDISHEAVRRTLKKTS